MARHQAAVADFTQGPRPPIELVPVTSSQIKAIGYDPDTQTLAVQFVHGIGSIYHYPDTPASVHADMIGAESIGKYFGKHIQGMPFKKYAP